MGRNGSFVGKKTTRKFGERAPYTFLEKFGRQEIELSSKMTHFPSKS